MAVRVSRDMLPTLLDKLKMMFPVSLQIHGTIEAIDQCKTDDSEIWVDTWPEVEAVLVYPSDNKTGVPVLPYENKMFATTEEGARRLLGQKKPLDGCDKFILLAVTQLLWPLLQENATALDFQMNVDCLAQMLYLPATVALPECPPIPDGYKLGRVQPRHAPMISQEWIYYLGKKTEDYMEGLINTFPNVALFEEVSGNLVAWMICYEDIAMGHLYVSPNHRRKSLGTICLLSLARKLRTNGQVPYLFILPENSVSLEFHRKVGFVDVDEKFRWIEFIKTR